MKMVTFPDGQSVPVVGIHRFALQIRTPSGDTKVCWCTLPAHAWAKANSPPNIMNHRVIVDVGDHGQPSKVVQVITPGLRAFVPGEYR
jgi:hypothetical protein